MDRSSIYGEEEEGWENVVVVDNNPSTMKLDVKAEKKEIHL